MDEHINQDPKEQIAEAEFYEANNLKLERPYFSCDTNGTECHAHVFAASFPELFLPFPTLREGKALGTRLPVLAPLFAYGGCARIASGSELSCGKGTIKVFFLTALKNNNNNAQVALTSCDI